MRIHHPKHPIAKFCHAALLAGVMIGIWLLLSARSPAPAHRAVATKAAMPVRAARLHLVSREPANVKAASSL